MLSPSQQLIDIIICMIVHDGNGEIVCCSSYPNSNPIYIYLVEDNFRPSTPSISRNLGDLAKSSQSPAWLSLQVKHVQGGCHGPLPSL